RRRFASVLVREEAGLDALESVPCERGREHRRRRVDGDDATAERRHCGGEEAGAGAEVDERRIRPEAEPLKELHVDADVEAGLRVVSGDVRGIEMLAARVGTLVEAHG